MNILDTLKIYFDTNAIGHLLAEHHPDRLQATRKLWDILEETKTEVFASLITFAEINNYENKERRDYLNEQLN